MIDGVSASLRWCLSLARKFGHVVFWRTSLIVLLTIISQVSTLLASVLPLKVIILLGSDGLPSYLPGTLIGFGREFLIVVLSVATVGFFLLHLLIEKLIITVTKQATRRLLASSQKMVLFENQDEVAANSYQRFSRALAAGMFVSIAILGLVLLYPDMAWAMCSYIATVVIVLLALASFSAPFRDHLEYRLQRVLTLVAGFGFFGAFAFLVVDFILLDPPAVLVAIVSLLLVRQVLNRLAALVQDIFSMFRQRDRINALFFHGAVLMTARAPDDKTIWPLLLPENRKEWAEAVLKEVVPGWGGAARFEWHPSSNHNAAVLRAQCEAGPESYLLKLFDDKRKAIAFHESTLLSEAPGNFPGPEFLGTINVGAFVCLAYRLAEGATIFDTGELKPHVNQLRKDLLAVEPPVGLAQRYQRSRPLLWQRIEAGLLSRLFVAVSTPEQSAQIARLLQLLPQLKQYLKSLPLVIVNPEIGSMGVWVESFTGQPLQLSWSRWALEPVGTKWPVGTGEWRSRDQVGRLAEALRGAAEVRPSLANVRPEVAELAALTAALEDRCLRQQFADGLELIDRILSRLDVLVEEPTVLNELTF